jgi:ribonuclease HI
MNKIIMYTDGGARNNPGPAAIGIWIETLGKKYSEYIGEATNNVAEYRALIEGLKKSSKLSEKTKPKNSKSNVCLTANLS